jgi:hypothetical protein
MPRFFIDTSDQNVFCRDEDGTNYPDLDAAKAAAVSALPDMARDSLPDGDAHTFTAVVRDEHDRPMVQASLILCVDTIPPSVDA